MLIRYANWNKPKKEIQLSSWNVDRSEKRKKKFHVEEYVKLLKPNPQTVAAAAREDAEVECYDNCENEKDDEWMDGKMEFFKW